MLVIKYIRKRLLLFSYATSLASFARPYFAFCPKFLYLFLLTICMHLQKQTILCFELQRLIVSNSLNLMDCKENKNSSYKLHIPEILYRYLHLKTFPLMSKTLPAKIIHHLDKFFNILFIISSSALFALTLYKKFKFFLKIKLFYFKIV